MQRYQSTDDRITNNNLELGQGMYHSLCREFLKGAWLVYNQGFAETYILTLSGRQAKDITRSMLIGMRLPVHLKT